MHSTRHQENNSRCGLLCFILLLTFGAAGMQMALKQQSCQTSQIDLDADAVSRQTMY
jgi:hypothetical protein